MTKTALITGGSRGIGKATADALRAQGWEVIAPTRAELECGSGYALSAINAWRENNRHLADKLNCLIHCAGEWYSSPIKEHSLAAYSRQYILSVVSLAALVNLFAEQLSVVVACASTRGFIGGVETAPYSCAKAAQIALMQGYAREYQGVRFNVVAPGWTDTDLGKMVKATGGVSNPNAVPQPAQAVADAILRLVNGEENGKVLRVVDGDVTEAAWQWK